MTTRRLGQPLPTTLRELCALRGLPQQLETCEAYLAASRASRYLGLFFGSLDTCLVRSLTLGALISDRPGVEVKVGFSTTHPRRPPPAGHAWVALHGEVPCEPDPESEAQGGHVVAMTIPCRRRPRRGGLGAE